MRLNLSFSVLYPFDDWGKENDRIRMKGFKDFRDFYFRINSAPGRLAGSRLILGNFPSHVDYDQGGAAGVQRRLR
jgi:hypothetical protein